MKQALYSALINADIIQGIFPEQIKDHLHNTSCQGCKDIAEVLESFDRQGNGQIPVL